MAEMQAHERTAPAGRFVGECGHDTLCHDVVWVEDDAAVSLHRVITTQASGNRLQRLATVAVDDILYEPHVTGGGAASAKPPSFLAVNMALRNIKTSLSGTDHAFDFRKYAHRYLGQVQYLFNRRFDLRKVLERLAWAACQAQPCPLRTVPCG